LHRDKYGDLVRASEERPSALSRIYRTKVNGLVGAVQLDSLEQRGDCRVITTNHCVENGKDFDQFDSIVLIVSSIAFKTMVFWSSWK